MPEPGPVRVSVVIPARDEAGGLPGVLAGVKAALGGAGVSFEVLVVDDGSSDGTGDAARKAGARVLRHPYPMGNGAAVKDGIRAARGEVVALMDADGQHDPADLPRLLEALGEEWAMAVGARTGGFGAGIHRAFANRVYAALASYVSGVRIPDLTSGFRVVRRDAARKFLYMLPNTFSYPSTLTLALLRSGRPVRFVPVKARGRTGTSKIHLLRDGARFFLIILRVATSFSPLRVFLPASMVSFAAGLALYLYKWKEAPLLTNGIQLLWLLGALLFFLGLLAEQIASLLGERGVEVVERRVPLLEEEGARTRAAGSPVAFLRAGAAAVRARAALREAYRGAPPHDAVLVGYPGALAAGVARRANRDRRRPVLLDAFLSLYDTAVNDRRLARPGSLRARVLRRLDRSSCAAADRVLVDTEENARWFEEEADVPRGKLLVVPVGAMPFPGGLAGPPDPPPPARPLEVLFFGTYVPLQGVPVLVEAAARVRGGGVRITLVGRGQDLPAARERAAALGLEAPDLLWVEEFLPREALDRRIAAADVCLGVFGATGKAARVVPCKVHDALAAGKPLVTADGPAARALLGDGREALLVPPGDPAALASALERLRDDPALRGRLAAGALRLWRERLTPGAVAGRLAEAMGWQGRPRTG